MADLLGRVREAPGQPGYGTYLFEYGNYGYPNHMVKYFSKEKYGSGAKAAALAYQKKLQPTLEKLTWQGKSKYDKIYNTNKSFREFVKSPEGNPKFNWEATKGNPNNVKRALYKRFLTFKNRKTKAGYNTTGKELAKLLGLESDYFDRVGKKARTGRIDATENIIQRLFPKVLSVKEGKSVNLYKDPTPAAIKEFKEFFDKRSLQTDTIKRVKEIDKKFRNMVVNGRDGKHLPELFEVMTKTSANTPSKAAAAMAVYSRALKGEKFRVPLNILKNNSAGEKLITELGSGSRDNAYRNAFYKLALVNVNKQFDQQGTLAKFKTDFSKALRKAMRLKDGEKIPYNINEVISLSAGESRGIRPFSVFIDATSAKINSQALASYQGQFSQRLGEVQDLLAKGKKAEARIAADKLLDTQKATAKNLLAEGFTEAQIKQLNLAEIKVGKTIDPKIYSPEKLARWKKAGLDIPQFVKEKGFYIDVKKAKPFWESNVRNTIVEAAKNNVGNVCNIFAGRVAFSKDGGRIGFQGGCGKEMAAAMEADAPGTLNEVSRTKGILPKFQNAATKFLQSPLLKKGGKFGALAAVGAAGAGLVKTFMNDDPTTYLSDENQQKNMLIDMITSPVVDEPKADSAILDYQLPVIGAGAVAGTAAVAPSTIEAARSGALGAKKSGITKTGLKTLGRGLASLGTPAALLATEPLFIGGQIAEGDSLGEIATDPINYLGAAFVDPATRFATRGLGPTASKIMRLGISPSVLKTVSRRFGLPGLALSLGISGYETFDDYRNKRGFFSEE